MKRMAIVPDSEEINIPSKIKMRSGHQVVCEGDAWHASESVFSCKFDFSNIPHEYFRVVLKLYTSYLLQVYSLKHTDNSFRYVRKFLMEAFVTGDYEESLIESIKIKIKSEKGSKSEYTLWYLKNWYCWCAGLNLSCFSRNFAEAFSRINIPGNEKGQSVMSLDSDKGPLDEEELSLYIDLISKDRSEKYKEERLKSWLFLTLGCNPRNLSLLKWCDFKIVSDGNDPDGHKVYLLSVPRIKKRTTGLRDEFKVRELDGRVGRLLDEFRHDVHKSEDYIFQDSKGNSQNSYYITDSVRNYASWLFFNYNDNGRQVHVTPRRLRYTFATRLVMAGASKEKVADLLDHTDLQHVQVYYDLRHKIKNFLSEAESKKLGEVFRKFEGNIISKKDQKGLVGDIKFHYSDQKKSPILGNCSSTSLCDLDPPFSCFLCPKFNAFEDSLGTYKRILSELVQWSDSRREEYGENDRIATVRNDIIISLGDLVQRIEKGQK